MRPEGHARQDAEQEKKAARARKSAKGSRPNDRAAQHGDGQEDKRLTPCDIGLKRPRQPFAQVPPAVVPCLVVIPAGAAIDGTRVTSAS